jgi:hypothetical protein
MEPISLIALTAVVVKVMTVLKSLTGPHRDINAVVTQFVTWGAGVGVLVLAAHAGISADLVFAGARLGDLDAGSLLLGGVMFGSAASVAFDAIGSRDEPKLTTIAPS